MKTTAKLLLVVILAVALILFWNAAKSSRMELRIKFSSTNNEDFSFRSIFDKNWTVAHVEYDAYVMRSDLQKKYNSNYHFRELFSDAQYRLVILGDNIVLNEYIFSFDSIVIDSAGLPITPDSIFSVSKSSDGKSIFSIIE